MEILKDASATAIYGSMGANGVVLITTKQGTSDTPRIEFSTMVDISTPRKHIDVLDLDQFLAYSDDVGVSLDIKEGEVLEARDWQDYTMRNAVSINTRVSVSGRSDKSNYYLAGVISTTTASSATPTSANTTSVRTSTTASPSSSRSARRPPSRTARTR